MSDEAAASVPPFRKTRTVARSRVSVAPDHAGRAFVRVDAGVTVVSCVPAEGCVIVGVSLRSRSRGFCAGGSAARRGRPDVEILPLDGETWSDAIARVGDLAPESFFILWLENRSGRTRPVEVVIDVLDIADREGRGSGLESGDAILERYERSAANRPPAKLADAAMPYVLPGVALTFDPSGARIIEGCVNGERVDASVLERQLLRAMRADARRSPMTPAVARLRKTLKGLRRGATVQRRPMRARTLASRRVRRAQPRRMPSRAGPARAAPADGPAVPRPGRHPTASPAAAFVTLEPPRSEQR